MTISLLDLVTPLTRQQVEKSLYDTMASLGVNTTGWKAGSVVRAIVTGVSIVQSAFSKLQSDTIKNQYLTYASGNWLKLLAKYGYGVDAFEATFATGQLTLTNSGGGTFILGIGDYVALNSSTGKTYRNTEAFTLNATSSVSFAIEAIEAGAASTSGPGQIDSAVTVLTAVTVANASAVVGQDPESDSNIKTRCGQKLGALSPNGPWDAYAYFARTATRPDGSLVGVTRTRNTKDGFGNLTTYVATATGALSGGDLAIVDAVIQNHAAPLTVAATTLNATIATIDITYTVYIYNTTGNTDAEIKNTIANHISEFFSVEPVGGNALPAGSGKVYKDAITSVIAGAYSEIFHVALALPASDTTLLLSDVPVIGTLIGTVAQVPPSAGY